MINKQFGAVVAEGATIFRVRAPQAGAVWLCLFDGDVERRMAMDRDGDDWTAEVTGVGEGARYGYRADADPSRLLVDPYATEVDQAFRGGADVVVGGVDGRGKVPTAVVKATSEPQPAIGFPPGGLIYELNVRGFTMRHPEVPAAQRGTIAALAHPAVIAHFRKLRVAAVELMPIVAWIDERHLPPLGLRNAWGYNPVVPMALDPRLAPGGVAELRDTIAALHGAGIAVILDLVFNHTGEGDADGPTLALRGLDDAVYARTPDGTLVNDAGTGNTLDFSYPPVRDLTLASLRHFARLGVDGFRFDLAPVLARGPGFDPAAPIFAEIAADPLLAARLMIAEPWDIGPGGYQLGNFPADWLEWNDRYRDDVRRFWRGDGSGGALATRVAGSSDVFGAERTRTVNFVAAHDGFTLADLVAYDRRHNEANGEANRDGHADEVSWNGGVEGPSDDAAIAARRDAEVRALLATLFVSRGAIMLTAGDEFGRTQRGNNNAYAQDNDVTWLDWAGRDRGLEDFVAGLADMREGLPALSDPGLRHDATWWTLAGEPMTAAEWETLGLAGFELRVDGVRVRFDRERVRVEILEA